MKKLFISLMLCVFVVSALSASPFSDVPRNHWAYDALNKLAAKGILQGYPNGVFKGNEVVTRYALALVVAKTLSDMEQSIKNGVNANLITKKDLNEISKLVEEFADELALVGVKVSALQDDMQMVKKSVSVLKNDVADIKDKIANGDMEKVRISGNWIVRHTYLTHKNDWAVNPYTGAARAGNSDNVLTESQIRFKFTANIDDNVTAVVRWALFKKNTDNINGGQSLRQSAFGRNGIGNLTLSDNTIDYAYLHIKHMFRFGGDFTFGRKLYYAGHGMMIVNYLDAIRYHKELNKVDLVAQAIYDRHIGNYKDTFAVDFYPVWNLDLTSYIGSRYGEHKVYLNYYHQEEPNLANRRFGLGLVLGNATGQQTGDSRWDLEFGSSGPLANNRLSYDLGFVYTDYKADVANSATTYWISPEMKGWMGHAAIKWDSKKAFKSKISYTYGNDEAVGGYSTSNYMRYVDAKETPYEDIARGNRYFVNGLQNMYDLKAQVEYKQPGSKHYFRLVGDWLDELDDTVTNDFTKYRAGAGQTTTPVVADKTNTAYDTWNNLGIADPKAFVFTFEYRYQLAKNTRIRVGYTNFNFTGDARKQTATLSAISAGRGFNNDYDYTMFWTEIYSKF